MWDVFTNNMGLDNSVEMSLANLDLNEPLLGPVTFGDGDTVEGSSSRLVLIISTIFKNIAIFSAKRYIAEKISRYFLF